MSFFYENLFQEDESSVQNDTFEKPLVEENDFVEENSEFDVNRQNEEMFNTVMKNVSKNNDDYWDNNLVIKIILIGLGLFILIGSLYIFILWYKTK